MVEKLARDIEQIVLNFSVMPEHLQQMLIALLFAWLFFISSFYSMVVSAIIFNYFLIPRIERKIGKKLEYHPLLDYIFMGKWMCRQDEIALYLVNRYLALKFKNDRGLPKYCLRYGLRKAGYTIDMASRIELVMSFILLFTHFLTIMSAVMILLMSAHVNVFLVNDG